MSPDKLPKIHAIRGVNDLFAPEVYRWQRLEEAARRLFTAYGYDEIRIPVIERTELFARSIGAATDVVEKEMYAFVDKGGDPIALRPEGTAGVVRAFVEHGLAVSDPSSRFWYCGPMFRHERPQKGRFRQFWQLGAEAFGVASPRVDAETLALLHDYLRAAGIDGVTIRLTSLGDEACRPPYRQTLTGFLRGVEGGLCEDCRRRIDTNPLRVLDCKREGCRAATAAAPLLVDRLCEPCAAHFHEVRRNLDLMEVPYELDPRIVRGLDYYVRTAFELVHRSDAGEALGSQNAIGGGGRYDGLVKDLGGPPVPGIGFALGMERLSMVLAASRGGGDGAPASVYLAALGPAAGDRAQRLAQGLRAREVRVETSYDAKANALGKELARADKRGARLVLILGEAELARNAVGVKDLRIGEQSELPAADVDALAAEVARRLRGT